MPKALKERKITVRFSEAEYETIRRRMEKLGIKNQSAFLRSMILNGYVLHLNLPEIRELIRLLGNMTNNLNQISRRENSKGHIYETELYEIQDNQKELANLLRKNLEVLEKYK